MLKRIIKHLFALFFLVFVLFCQGNTDLFAQEKLSVYTSVYPVYDVTSKIVGGKADVNLVVPNGTELHGYEPSPRQLAGLEKADLFFYIGIGLESWADKIVENLKTADVNTIRVSKNLELIKFEDDDHIHDDVEHLEHEEVEDHEHESHHIHEHDEVEHNENEEHHVHEEEYDHNHGLYDPHVWLDPINMKKIAETIKDELIHLDPDNKDYYQQNYDEFDKEIDILNTEYNTVLEEKDHEYILVSHSAFGYLARRYGFRQLSVTGVSPHAEPSPKKITELIKMANNHNLEYIFMETLSSPKVVNVFAEEAKLSILTLDPIAGLTEEDKENNEDYFSLMRKNLINLEKALVR